MEEEIPQDQRITGPGHASFLDLSKRALKEFPAYLYGACVQLKYLYLEGNCLEELAECFFPSLGSLKWLDVRNNALQTLPKSIAHHPNLEVLLLQGNQIQALPLELGLVPRLRGVQLLGNPITFPPKEVLEGGVRSMIEFLRDEHNIQAPSPSTIRPVTGTTMACRKRAASSSLPPITLIRPKTTCGEAKMHNNLLKQMFLARIREMLQSQGSILQRTKDEEMLKKWRQLGVSRNTTPVSTVLPYDTDPYYMTFPSRADLHHPRHKTQSRKAAPLENLNEEMSDIFHCLQKLGESSRDAKLSPRTEQDVLNSEIQTLVRLQKKLQVLHFRNAQQDITVPSLPVRGQRVHATKTPRSQ